MGKIEAIPGMPALARKAVGQMGIDPESVSKVDDSKALLSFEVLPLMWYSDVAFLICLQAS